MNKKVLFVFFVSLGAFSFLSEVNAAILSVCRLKEPCYTECLYKGTYSDAAYEFCPTECGCPMHGLGAIEAPVAAKSSQL